MKVNGKLSDEDEKENIVQRREGSSYTTTFGNKRCDHTSDYVLELRADGLHTMACETCRVEAVLRINVQASHLQRWKHNLVG